MQLTLTSRRLRGRSHGQSIPHQPIHPACAECCPTPITRLASPGPSLIPGGPCLEDPPHALEMLDWLVWPLWPVWHASLLALRAWRFALLRPARHGGDPVSFSSALSLIIARDPPRPVRDRPCHMWVAPVGRDEQRYTCHPGGLNRSQFDDRFI